MWIERSDKVLININKEFGVPSTSHGKYADNRVALNVEMLTMKTGKGLPCT